MGALLALIDRVSFIAAVIAAICLALMALSILSEVVSVTLFNETLVFTWEVSAFLMAAAFFLGLPWTLNSGGHVRVQILPEALPQRARPALDLAATVIALAVTIFLTVALAQLAWGSLVDGSRTFTATATPLVIPQAVVAFGSFLLGLQLFARIVRLLSGKAPDTAKSPSENA
ncbi:MAG: TRAP transporter small permease [Pseudomonadota bacterium]